MSNQEERIAKYCEDYGSITAWQAMKDLGIMRLASRIHDMRAKYNITDVWVDDINRYGDKIRYKKYILSKNKINEKSNI